MSRHSSPVHEESDDALLDRAVAAINRVPAPAAVRDRAIGAAIAAAVPSRGALRLRLARVAVAAALVLAVGLVLILQMASVREGPPVRAAAANKAASAGVASDMMEPPVHRSGEKAISTLRPLTAAAAPILIANGPANPVRLGETLPAAASTGHLHVWDYSWSATSRVVPEFEFPANLPAALTPDGATLVFADGAVLNLATGWRAKVDLGGATYQVGPATYTRIGDMQFSPDGSRVALLVTLRDEAERTTSEVVQIRSYPEGKVVCEFPPAEQYALRLAFSPDGKRVATADRDRRILLRDASTGQVVKRFDPPLPAQVLSVSISPDGRRLAAAARDDAGALIVWDAGTGAVVRRPDPAKFPRPMALGFAVVQFSPDGRHLAAGGFDGAIVFDAGTGQAVSCLRTPSARHLDWSADGQRLTVVTAAAVTDDRPRRQVYPEAQRWDWRAGRRADINAAQP